MMQFLIDGHRDRCTFRREQWEEAVLGQLLTPLTRYRRGEEIYAIDNGCFSSFRKKEFISLLKREWEYRHNAIFVVCPDSFGDAKTTSSMWEDNNHLCNGFKKAFVAQDGYDGMPKEADTLFIGGSNNFKDSVAAYEACKLALADNKHVHVGRVNGADRFIKYDSLGANTCDGSGISRYDHMILRIKQIYNAKHITK